MYSITEKLGRFPVFQEHLQDSCFEYGVKVGGHHVYPYCAWKVGDDIKEIIGSHERFDNDEVLLKVAEDNPDAARRLFCRQLALDDPTAVSKAMISAGVFRPTLNAQTDSDPAVYLNTDLPEYTELWAALLFYGWKPDGKKSILNEASGKEVAFLRKLLPPD